MTIPFLLLGQNKLVNKYRRLSGIKYPQCTWRVSKCFPETDLCLVYAEKAEAEASKEAYIFNCAQRE